MRLSECQSVRNASVSLPTSPTRKNSHRTDAQGTITIFAPNSRLPPLSHIMSAAKPTRVVEKSAAPPELTTSVSPPNSIKLAMDPAPASASDPSLVDPKEHVTRLTEDMFKKVAEYMRGELMATSDDYRLLETMNNVTRDKYSDMSALAQTLMGEMSKVQTTYVDFSRYVVQIDEVSKQIDYLEQVANELDDYSKGKGENADQVADANRCTMG
ncbi:biogenesis of lysosome-related organelles complex-1 subunit 2-domain-containing protein [Jimgerdemannia flammicorona]|uniref:Biogenesis of lysosome-related organelles complex-1 subunit 2-domain-containing protein n=1 Tax=Jimgerdemannia flammicorona TaxID=994334 RepID=A0A433Q139_9FUNG|nr:biogenesis of lysosome-related organelles complex-1 subunit 2-domain-containing protein [Jimgerdemannia flammicorona]